MITRKDVLTNARFAGSLRRYHTWPVLQQQTNAEHTWHVMCIFFQIWGPLPPHISTYLLWHDAGEIVTGDLPFPFKANNPDIKVKITKLEHGAITGMGGQVPQLSADEASRVKAADLIEMHLFGCQEMLLGNKFGGPIIDDTYAALTKLPLDGEDTERVFSYLELECRIFNTEFNIGEECNEGDQRT